MKISATFAFPCSRETSATNLSLCCSFSLFLSLVSQCAITLELEFLFRREKVRRTFRGFKRESAFNPSSVSWFAAVVAGFGYAKRSSVGKWRCSKPGVVLSFLLTSERGRERTPWISRVCSRYRWRKRRTSRKMVNTTLRNEQRWRSAPAPRSDFYELSL